MKKKILILLLILLLTGCKADYNLKINFGGNVVESGSIYIDSNLLGKGTNPSNYDEYLNQQLKKYGAEVYRTKIKFKSGNYMGFHFYHRYNNVSGYADQTFVTNILYDYIRSENNNGYVTLHSAEKSKLSEFHNLTSDIPTRVEGIEVSISLPYKVVKNNATRVDLDNNEYTWTLTPGMASDNIILEYRENQLYTTNPLYLARFVSVYVYIFIGLILLTLIAIAIIRSKLSYMNKL